MYKFGTLEFQEILKSYLGNNKKLNFENSNVRKLFGCQNEKK